MPQREGKKTRRVYKGSGPFADVINSMQVVELMLEIQKKEAASDNHFVELKEKLEARNCRNNNSSPTQAPVLVFFS